jgi:hypothetical protein
MSADHDHHETPELLDPLELHIIDLLGELSASIAALCDDEVHEYPLAEFDQRLLLEHVQVIERYVLAQAAARAFPDRFRLIGEMAPRSEGASLPASNHSHDDSGHDHDHDDSSHEHHVADPAAAREAHSLGRAIIGEHPWEQDHEHGDGHSHADEWEWEPIGPEGA